MIDRAQVPSNSDPEAFFAQLSARALVKAKAAPALVEVMPMDDRGWRLSFQVANGHADIVEVNALCGPAAKLEYSYRSADTSSPRREHLDRVGHLLCKALARARIDGPLPAVQTREVQADADAEREPEPPPREIVSSSLPGECDRGCVFCAVSTLRERDRPRQLPIVPDAVLDHARAEVESTLRANAIRAAEIQMEWSGEDCLRSPLFDEVLRLAHELGYRDMGVQTPGSRLIEDGFIEFLSAHSVVRVGLTAHAGDQATFDEVGGKVGAYAAFWTAFERLLAGPFQVSLAVPCVAKTIEGLPQHLANLAGFACGLTCFLWYPDPDAGMDHTFGEIGVSFERAIETFERVLELVPPRRIAIDGLPECMVPPGLREHFYWSYGDEHMRPLVFERIQACTGCAARERCPGVASVYLQHHELQVQPVTEPSAI